MDGLVSLAFVEGAVIFRSGKCWVMMDRLRVPYTWLVFDGTKDFVDRELQRGEVLSRSEGSECIQRENRECLLLEGGLPQILIAGMGRSLALRVRLLFSLLLSHLRK